MKRLIYLLCVLLAVPALGLAVAAAIQHHVNAGAACPFRSPADCRAIGEAIDLLRNVSLVVGGAGLLLPLAFWSAARVIGSNRRWLALVFPVLVRVSLVAMAGIVLVQVGVLLYAVYLGQTYAQASVPLFLFVLVAFSGLFVCAALVMHALTLGGGHHAQVVAGRVLDRQAYPAAHAFVDDLAQRLGARSPDNLVVGLHANFFVTSAKVRILNQPQGLEGETLFLSLPLCRVLTAGEIAAIVGHELGHFRGHDTVYSLRFAPVYFRLTSALLLMVAKPHWGIRLAAMPAMAMAGFMLEVFARNEATISRERELEADRASIEVASVEAFAAAHVKTAAYTPVWAMYLEADLERLGRGLATRNLSVAFADCIRYDLDTDKLAALADETLQTRIAHPTDTHPPIAERLAAVGREVSPDDMKTMLTAVDGTAAALGDLDGIERELTAQRREMLIAAGLKVPKEDELSDDQKRQRAVLNVAYALGAAIVTADGWWTHAQWLAAESGPEGYADIFSRIDFREQCRYPRDRLDPAAAARALADTLDESCRDATLEWLRRIALADPEPAQSAVTCYDEIERLLRG